MFTQGMVMHETYRAADGHGSRRARSRSATACAGEKARTRRWTIGPSEKMSKSKKNVIAPETIIDIYGADAIRWFMLSDTPPERDIEWTEDRRGRLLALVQRVYRLVTKRELPAARGGKDEARGRPPALELRRATHRAIAAVTEDLEALRFNRAVARIYELANAVSGCARASPAAVKREALETLVKLIAPMMPHLAESGWEALGHTSLLVEEPWPAADPALVRADTITIAVQVDGKRRGEIAIPRGADQELGEGVRARARWRQPCACRKTPRRIVVVPERIVNIVT